MVRTQKIFLPSFCQSINIFNIMARFGRYDHVTKNLIVFGHPEGHQCSRGNLIRRLFRDARSTLLHIWLRNKSKAQWSVNL